MGCDCAAGMACDARPTTIASNVVVKIRVIEYSCVSGPWSRDGPELYCLTSIRTEERSSRVQSPESRVLYLLPVRVAAARSGCSISFCDRQLMNSAV